MELTDAAKREAALVVRAERAEACLRDAVAIIEAVRAFRDEETGAPPFGTLDYYGFDAFLKDARALLAQIEGE